MSLVGFKGDFSLVGFKGDFPLFVFKGDLSPMEISLLISSVQWKPSGAIFAREAGVSLTNEAFQARNAATRGSQAALLVTLSLERFLTIRVC